MQPATITIIISVYKNIKALEIILESIKKQTVLANEIIISEDCQTVEMREFISTQNNPKIVHLSQEDSGWRKNIALNRAIQKAKSEYLIFIDGDVVLHHKFIEGHILSSDKKIVCCGKRSSLGEGYSKKVYAKEIDIADIYGSYLFKFYSLHKDDIKHYEDGIHSPFLNMLTSSRYVRHIIGCNFSCYKEDIVAINGFDEDFKLPSVGEDVDISWRFRGLGIELKSCRYTANQYHLWHKKNFNKTDLDINQDIMDENVKKQLYRCLNGIEKL